MPPPKRRSNLITRVVEGEVVILDRETGHVHRLNTTASHVWNECDGTRTAADIAARLAASFGETSGDVLDDVKKTIVSFGELGLLVED